MNLWKHLSRSNLILVPTIWQLSAPACNVLDHAPRKGPNITASKHGTMRDRAAQPPMSITRGGSPVSHSTGVSHFTCAPQHEPKAPFSYSVFCDSLRFSAVSCTLESPQGGSKLFQRPLTPILAILLQKYRNTNGIRINGQPAWVT